MGKGARNRAIREYAQTIEIEGFSPRSVARALRRHGRLPIGTPGRQGFRLSRHRRRGFL